MLGEPVHFGAYSSGAASALQAASFPDAIDVSGQTLGMTTSSSASQADGSAQGTPATVVGGLDLDLSLPPADLDPL